MSIEMLEDNAYRIISRNNLLKEGSQFGKILTRIVAHNDDKKSRQLISEEEHSAYANLFRSERFRKKLNYYIVLIPTSLLRRHDLEAAGQSIGSGVGGVIGSYLATCFASCLYAPLALISNCLVPATCVCCWSFIGKIAAPKFATMESFVTVDEVNAIYAKAGDNLISQLDKASNPTEFVESIQQSIIRHRQSMSESRDVDIMLGVSVVTGCVNAAGIPFGILGSGATAFFATTAGKLCETHLNVNEEQQSSAASQPSTRNL